jgi:ankyrin repeat protein
MAIYNAIMNPSESVPILQAFVDAGWDVNTKMKYQGDALVIAVNHNRVDAVRLLLKSGAHHTLNEGSNGRTTLGDAAVCASPEIISMLIESGAEIKQSHALELAARAGRRDNVECLLKKGADIDEVPDKESWNVSNEDIEAGLGSALHAAASEGHADIVSLLLDPKLEKKADVLLEDSKGRTALRRAVVAWHPYVAALLSVALF